MGSGYLGGGALKDHNHGAPGDGGVLSNLSVNGTINMTGTPAADTNAVRRQDIAARNLIINGGFDIWQRATSFVSVADGAWTADKWKHRQTNLGAANCNVSRSTNGPKFLPYELNCAYLGGNGATTTQWVEQDVEEFQNLLGQTVTLSAWVRGAAAGLRIGIDDGVSAEARSAFIVADNTYRLLTVTATIAANATRCRIKVGFLATPDMNNGTIAGSFFVDGVTLVVGSVAIPYLPEPMAQLVVACKRGYEKKSKFHYTFHDGTGSSGFVIPQKFAIEMSAVPTITVNGGTLIKATSVSSVGADTMGFGFLINSGAGTGFTSVGNADDGTWTAEVA